MKVRIVGKTEYIRKTEYSECTSNVEFKVPKELGEDPTDEEIINAISDQFDNLDFELSVDKEYVDDVKFEIERYEDDEEESFEDEDTEDFSEDDK